MATENIDTFHD